MKREPEERAPAGRENPEAGNKGAAGDRYGLSVNTDRARIVAWSLNDSGFKNGFRGPIGRG